MENRTVSDVRTAQPDDLADVVRPFVWVGALAFVTGFWGYLIVAPLIGG